MLRGLAELDRRLVGLARQRQEVAESRERSQALATQVGEAKSTALRYESEGKELNAKLALLQNGEAGRAVCSLCQTPLNQDSCLRLADSYRDQVGEKRGLYRQNRDLRGKLEKELADLEKELSQQEKALADESTPGRRQPPGTGAPDSRIPTGSKGIGVLRPGPARFAQDIG